MTDPLFSIVVPTRHRPERLERFLQNARDLAGVEYEILIVDNSDGDPAVRRSADAAGARYVVEPQVGLSRARNAGARAARGTYVAFTDDDATPRRDWLLRHLEVLAANPAPAATTGRVLRAPSAAPAAAAYDAAGAEDLGRTAFFLDNSQPEWFTRVHFGGLGVGANIVFRRALFESGLRFREALGPPRGLPGEEHYALFDVLASGHAIAYVPDAVVDHDPLPPTEEVGARHRSMLRGQAAYALMLLVEGHGRRYEIVRYLMRAIRHPRQQWREPVSSPMARREKLSAGATGVWKYLSWRRRSVGSGR